MLIFHSLLAAVLIPANIALIYLVAVVGSAFPEHPSFIAQNPCSLPCVYGITPGETNQEQVRALVAQIAGDNYSHSPVDGGGLIFRMENDGFAVLGTVSLDLSGSDQVRAVGVLPVAADDLGYLGDIIASGLQPVAVYRSCDTTMPVMLIGFGAGSRIVAEFPLARRLRPETPITFLRVYQDEGNTLGESMLSFGCMVETGWHGFAPRWVYLARRSHL
jgi:hypothetical protein